VTYGAQPLSRAVAAVSDSNSWRACNGIFYLLNAPAGTANVTVTFPATVGNSIDNRHAGAFVLYNVAQQPPQAIATAGEDATTNPTSKSITTQNAWIVDVITRGNTGTFTPTQAAQTLRWQASCTSSSSATSTKEAPLAGATTLGWSHSAPNRYAHALAAFVPVAAAP
jgi:hypothetical protein